MVLTCSSKEVTRGWMRSSAKEPTSLSVSAGSDGSPAAISSSTWRETTRATSSEVTCVTKALSAAVSPLRSSARSALYRSIRVFWSTDASVESARSRSLMSMPRRRATVATGRRTTPLTLPTRLGEPLHRETTVLHSDRWRRSSVLSQPVDESVSTHIVVFYYCVVLTLSCNVEARRPPPPKSGKWRERD